MGKTEKLIEKLKTRPKNFTFSEMQTILEALGFEMQTKGKTSGSRVKFMKGNVAIMLHKPHPRKELLEYQIKQILYILKKEGIL